MIPIEFVDKGKELVKYVIGRVSMLLNTYSQPNKDISEGTDGGGYVGPEEIISPPLTQVLR
jgi:hypothetical protein